MKKISLKNILIITILITAFFTGSFPYQVYCQAEECCETECSGVEISESDFSQTELSFTVADCCEYGQTAEKEVTAISSLNVNSINIKSSLKNTTSLNTEIKIPENLNLKYISGNSSIKHIIYRNSISVLRI